MRIPRFWSKEMKGWPKTDANLILMFEIVINVCFSIDERERLFVGCYEFLFTIM